ncbi:hypothetical protein BKA61DRAFT_592863 [Leptodontidium sp. MPI-SDFR-AT-0119]|nr:hypothetical protein BKA61DRAFT_592863 [Leptodontidium sp. MPI-SDFR-AT-0119]
MSENLLTESSHLIQKIQLVQQGSAPPNMPHRPQSIGSNLPSASQLSSLIVPGEPFVTDVRGFLQRELVSPTLDELAPILTFVARKGGSNIDALHVQLIKNRSIIITEDPGLHLIWYGKSIYLKPIPHCLLSTDFWTTYLPTSSTDPTTPQNSHPLACPQYRPAAIGLVRSYAYLIRHSSDFHLAQAAHLIPSSVTYTEFQHFIQPFLHTTLVSPRYEYGQLRLTRLNWAVRLYCPPSRKKDFITRRWYYQETQWGIRDYIQSAAVFLVFMFAALSLILSSMQVVLAARQNDTWEAFVKASWGFSIGVILFFIAIFAIIGIGALLVLFAQLNFAMKARKEGKESDGMTKRNRSA